MSYNPAADTVISDVANLKWKKYLVNYSDLSSGLTINDVELFSLTGKGIIRSVIISHNTQFQGPGLTSLKANVGLTGDLKRYSSDFEATAVPGDGVYQIVDYSDFPSKIAATSVRVSAESTGCNLNQLTQGQLEIQILWSTLS